MAQQYQTTSGVLTIPGAYVQTNVQTTNSGLATTGVIAVIGEADSGPDFTAEVDITQNGFGPDQLPAVLAKYKSGPVVDAFRACATPANDPQIQGAASKIFILKTNPSVKASSGLLRSGLTNYGTLADKSFGPLGNNLYFNVSAVTSENPPIQGLFTLIPTPSGSTLGLRVNGNALATSAIVAKAKPTATVGSISAASATGLSALSNTPATSPIYLTGGNDRLVLSGLSATSSLAVAASGFNITITLSGVGTTWGTVPTAGDTLMIPGANGDYGISGTGSVIAGAASANAGAYVVTAATALTITATKLRNNVAGALVAPVNVAATPISVSPPNDLIDCKPISITNSAGVARSITATGNVSGTAAGMSFTLTLATSQWSSLPQVGDYLFVPSTATAATATAHGGWSVVTAATTTSVTCTRLSDDRAPATLASTLLATPSTNDLQFYRPVIDGVSKCVEVQDAGGVDNISTLFYNLSTTPVSWISTLSAPFLSRSLTEYKCQLQTQRASDSTNEVVTAGGDIVLYIGYQGTTASLVITSSTITSTVTGGVGASFSFPMTSFRTVGDFIAKVASLPGYFCTASTSAMASLPIGALDEITVNFCSTNPTVTVGIKKDAYAFFQNVSNQSSRVQFGTSSNPALLVMAASGLPEVQSNTFLTGAARGATTNAVVTTALTACEKIKTNFIVPCFSQNASLDSVATPPSTWLAITDPTSTYTVDGINAACLTHAIKMSTLQRRRPRIAIVSKRDTYANAKIAAGNLASARAMMFFQDVKGVASDGTIQQFQPWFAAALAAGFQAAGFYRPIFKKGVNCSGVVQNAGDFFDSDETAVSDALTAGLDVIRARDTGGFEFVSDQLTYSFDQNFVYNSLQAMYVADTIAMTIAQRLEQAFVGQNFADVSAALVISYLKGVISDLRRLKLVTASDDAPEGYKDMTVTIVAPAIVVNVTLIEATGIYFIPITTAIQQVKQFASA